MRTMDEKQREIIIAMADHNMSIQKVADALYRHRNTVDYHIGCIRKKYGLDPRNFYDLCKLLEMAKKEEVSQ